jgi:hypothetical protein
MSACNNVISVGATLGALIVATGAKGVIERLPQRKQWSYGVMALFALTAIHGAACAQNAQDADARTTPDPFENIGARVFGDVRLRYESAVDGSRIETGRAATVRLRSAVEIAPDRMLSFLGEFEGNLRLAGAYDDLVNGEVSRAVIADPEFAELNRLSVRFEPSSDAVLTVGRQYLSFDDERFVGRVAFRQNDQTFDATRISISRPSGVAFDAVYLWRANRVLSGRNDEGRFRGDSYLLNASIPLPYSQLTGFLYALDLGVRTDEGVQEAASSMTTGVRIEGRAPWPGAADAGWHLKWEGSFASQRDFAQAPDRFRARYWLGSIAADAERFSLGIRFEILGSGGAQSFQTPLGTLHAFQGAADVFLTTPAEGVRERSAFVEWRAGRIGPFQSVALAASGLSFQSANGETNLGREFDAGLRANLSGATLSAKVADYTAAGFGSDVRRIWLTIERGF